MDVTRKFTSVGKFDGPLISGVPSQVQYVRMLLDETHEILSDALNQALAVEAEALADNLRQVEPSLADSFQIRVEGTDIVYGFTDPAGLTFEYGGPGRSGSGFLRKAVVRADERVGRSVNANIERAMR